MEKCVRTIYFTVGGKQDSASLHPDARPEDVRELFRSACGAAPGDVIKLYTSDGHILNAGTPLPANTPANPYRLHVAATPCNGEKLNRLGIDLMDLEQRLCEVERSVAALRADLPPAVEELRCAVETFRMRLETTEHLSWLGFYKKGIGEPLGNLGSPHPYWKNVEYRRKAEDEVATVCSKFKEICDGVVGKDTQELLRLPSFNNWAWEDWEILLLLQHMYNDLGLLSKFGIETDVFRRFLCRVYHCYNQVPFHNFMHAFCVTQMMYGMICKCDLQRRLGDLDALILLTSCICHDLDHPGFNNIYQINARTELALRYNDISPLENHHCSVAFSVLERNECNIFKNLTADDYKKVREGIIRCILATDMARHNEILSDFRDIIPEFAFDNRAHVNVLSMVLIKVADISNEARPLDIAEPWLDCLMQEFFNQSDLEKLEGLPVSPFMDREKVTKPSSQCSFIGFVLLPLFEALGKVLPELDELIIQPVRFALDHYRKLNEAAKKASEEQENILEPAIEEEELEVEKPNTNSHLTHLSRENSKRVVQKTESSFSIGSRASSRMSMYRSSTCDYGDGTEMDTETEVDVSERTSRFKIATDIHISPSRRNSSERRSSVGGRSSCERTVSPRALEDRLLPHAEAKNEPEDEVHPKKSEKESLFARFRIFSERLSSSEKERTSNGSTLVGSRSTRCKQSGLQSVLKRSRSKSEPTKSRHHRTFHISRPRISFGTNPPKSQCDENMFNSHEKEKAREKCKESSSEGLISSLEIKTSTSFELIDQKKPCVSSSAQPSPTLSEKCVLVTNSILKHKGFSLSLDVLPRKNGRLRRSAATETHTAENTPGGSEDNLLEENKKHEVDGAVRLFRHHPMLSHTKGVQSTDGLKGLKKKPESTRALLFKSLSFRKKSPTKDDDMRPGDSGGPSEERL
ncbi:high affinity cGMP-specific 3',5'-cyclic phosphodiesterase 9A-like isoform X1 [Portunus trituberculatus]|uniref:high affinity cGMP-specific 3',5'-cyclic phosphodiesterase 9A-like isoform X1 n=3 Tax=Portunus trituberculatus TaxID=210409 RepID=UPI001E1CC610|nr:high affinity cGMP-specific 3',5'-cyclic phosphodiesterase 9A-like isoform X1 [Portunus trituberculatus]